MNIEKVIAKVLAAANTKRTDAGFQGSRGDGGATAMEAGVRFYRAGLRKELPEEWAEYAHEAKQEADPEHAEYVRLKKKFG